MFEGFASIKSNNIVFISYPEAFDDEICALGGELPHLLIVLIVLLSCCVEHVLSQCRNRSSLDAERGCFHSVHEGLAHIRLCQLYLNHCAVAHEQTNHAAESYLNSRSLRNL